MGKDTLKPLKYLGNLYYTDRNTGKWYDSYRISVPTSLGQELENVYRQKKIDKLGPRIKKAAKRTRH